MLKNCEPTTGWGAVNRSQSLSLSPSERRTVSSKRSEVREVMLAYAGDVEEWESSYFPEFLV